LRGSVTRWAGLTCAPPLFQILIQGGQLVEVTFVNLGLRWPDIVQLDTECADDMSLEVRLLKHLAHCRDLRQLPVFDGARRYLDSHYLKRDVVMAEDQEPTVAHDVTDNLPHEPAIRSDRQGFN